MDLGREIDKKKSLFFTLWIHLISMYTKLLQYPIFYYFILDLTLFLLSSFYYISLFSPSDESKIKHQNVNFRSSKQERHFEYFSSYLDPSEKQELPILFLKFNSILNKK